MDLESGLEELDKRREFGLQMGGPEKIEKQHQSGHLTARERIDKLLDPGSFIEEGLLEQYEIPDTNGRKVPTCEINGFGKINGRVVRLHVMDHTVLAGSDEPRSERHRPPDSRLARGVSYPFIVLGHGGGARLQEVMGSDGLLGAARGGGLGSRLLNFRQSPHIATIMGECYGSPTWLAASSDFVVMVKGACMAVSGPRVLEVAKDEQVTTEELGGWKLHAEVTGEVDAFAEDDIHCLEIVKDLLSYMPSNCDEEPPFVPTDDPPERRAEEIMKILPSKSNRVYDVYKIIKAIVDDGKYLSLKPYFGKAIVTCLARLGGRTVGFIANQPLYNAGAGGPDECEKVTSFIVLCDTYNIPLIFLHDTPGFLVGPAAEKRKMPVKIMVWLQALHLATVPKISIVLRKTYGMAMLNMCATMCEPDCMAAWPTAEISFMSPEAAANVVFKRKVEEAANPEEEKERLIKQMEKESAPWKAAEKALLDDVIDPRDTRRYLIDYLELLHGTRGGFTSQKYLQHWPTGF